MNQMKYSVQDLWRHKGNSFVLLLETIMLLVIVNLIAWSLNDMSKMKNEIQRLNATKEIYGLINFTGNMQQNLLLQDDKNIPKLNRIYDSIYANNKVEAFSLYSSTFNLKKSSFGNPEFLYTSDANVFIPYVYANDLFFKYFNLEVEKGRTFRAEDYQKKSSIIPILIGSDLTFKYKLGDILSPLGSQRYQVVGILKQDSSYIDIMATRDFKNLDRMILLPLNKNDLLSALDYESVITRAYVATDDTSALAEIVQRAAESNTLSFAFKSMLYQSKFVAQDKEKSLQIQILLSSLILVFTFVTVTVSYLQFIEKHIYEFGVHLLSGATRSDLALRLGGQFLLLLALGNLVTALVFGAFSNLAVSLSVSALLAVVFLTIPVIRLNRMSMTSMLRGRSR
ncbi:ABC transporter permease [Saccharibacillus brassicae]|uniref:ABC transporter permease n=1 Tax=Saccharibacillus brassicae TaxID=2583377 RepID=A0A4Y6UVC6_SACBS|nr:ABC transporter permease [Saccharibacillus brassicae]QDH21663.1 ABC transporter permease [Saccharibacillus brassicae]